MRRPTLRQLQSENDALRQQISSLCAAIDSLLEIMKYQWSGAEEQGVMRAARVARTESWDEDKTEPGK